MPRLSSPQRWASVVLVGLLIGLTAVYGAPALAYRISLAIHQGRLDAGDKQLDRQLDTLTDTSQTFRKVAEKVKRSVVHVEVVQALDPVYILQDETWRKTQSNRRYESGSGVIIDQAGYILTNQHVVSGADKLEVKLSNNHRFKARLVGADARMDLALLKIDSQGERLDAAELGDSDALAVGDWVLAIGNPFGLNQSVTAGIVSARGQQVLPETFDIQDLIQTDAAINPGNSGGPLVNLLGRVVGINTFILGDGNLGIGFAIPASLAARAKSDFITYGRIRRGWLGLLMHPVERPTQPDRVVMSVDYVVPGGPGVTAGIRVGDLLLDFDGQPFISTHELQRRIERSQPDTRVPLSIERDGKKSTRTVEIGMTPAGGRVLPGEAEWGIGLGYNVSLSFAQRLGLRTNKGLLVETVEKHSPAADVLWPGDLIVAVNGRETPTLLAYLAAVRDLDKIKTVTLTVLSAEGLRSVELKQKE